MTAASGPRRPDLPTGTVTFLFSDLEGSTRLTQELGTATYRQLLEEHHRILREAFGRHGGVERGTQGDAFLVIFRDAAAATSAAVDAQRGLLTGAWPAGVPVRVRMGLHAGEGIRGGDDYVGTDVNRAARVASAAHGGLVLLSEAAHVLTERSLPDGVTTRDLGEHRLKDLAVPEHLHQLVIDGVPSSFPPLRTASAQVVDLPSRLTAFVGRDPDLAEVEALLARTRLLTLTGPGGTGKTSLAVEVARRRTADFPGGVWFVPLDGVEDPAYVASAIAAALRMPDPGSATAERIAAFLGDRAVLLVLDNFEQVLEAAKLVADVVRAASGLRVLVTSRAALHVAGEQEIPIPPLGLPGAGESGDVADAAAVRLFLDRARLVNPSLGVVEEDLGVIADVCRRLDGLPLGIELAAAHAGRLPVTAIRDRLGSRLDLPGPQSRDLPERQRTLGGSIAWSYELLSERERTLLAVLAVFAGGFRIEEAEPVGAAVMPGDDVVDALLRLVDQSLVAPPANPDRPRYRLLDTIRMFALDRLRASGLQDVARRAHAEAMAALFQRAATHVPGREQVLWMPILEAEADNLRAAIRWAIDTGDISLAMRLGSSAWRFWQIRGYVPEGRALIDQVLTMPGADRPIPERVAALEAAGGLHYWSSDQVGAARFYQEQIDVARAVGDAHGIADGMFNAAHTAGLLGDNAGSIRLSREARQRYLDLGDLRAAERTRIAEAMSLQAEGRSAEAYALVSTLVERYRELDDVFYLGLATGVLAGLAMILGRPREGVLSAIEGVEVSRMLGDIASLAIGLGNFGIIGELLGRDDIAVTIDAAFNALCDRYGVRPPGGLGLLPGVRESVDEARSRLSEDAAARATAIGRAMTLDEALDYSVALLRAAAEMLPDAPVPPAAASG